MLCLIELLSLLLSRKDTKNLNFNIFPFMFKHNTHLAGISGRELRAPASGTQMNS